MFESGGMLVALCLVLIVGLGFPISALLAARRGGEVEEANMYRRFISRTRNPWQPEDDQMEELSKRVEDLNKDK